MRRSSLFAVLILVSFAQFCASSAVAQIVTLTGAVTDHSGIYSGSVGIGDQVSLEFEVNNPVDIFHGIFAPNEAAYIVDFATFSIAGAVKSFPAPAVYVVNFPGTSGLFFNHTWSGFAYPDGGLSFQLESVLPVISSLGSSPSDVPITDFDRRTGIFYTKGTDNTGSVSWIWTGYSGGFGAAAVSPVPEPMTYGWCAAIGLVGLSALKRRSRLSKTE